MREKIAVIDVGTNTVKLLVARYRAGELPRWELFRQETVRLGSHLQGASSIDPAALARAAEVIGDFLSTAAQEGASRTLVYGTHVFRKAADGAEAARRLSERCGVPIRILSPEEEGRFALASAERRALVGPERTYLADVGGGSTELVLWEGGSIEASASLEIGALTLTELFFHSDPPEPGEVKKLRDHLRRTLKEATQGWLPAGDHRGLRKGASRPSPSSPRLKDRPSSPERAESTASRSLSQAGRCRLVVSGGTASTLARMLALPPDSARVDAHDLSSVLTLCLSTPLARRRGLPGLDPRRADIIPAGLLVLSELVDLLGVEAFWVNHGGVREGILIALAEENP